MLKESDIKALRRSASRRWRIAIAVTYGVALAAMLTFGVLNLYFASRYASAAGTSLSSLVKDDLDRYSARQQYSRAYVKAVDRLTVAFLDIGTAIVIVVMSWVTWKRIRFEERLLRFVEDSGSLTSACNGRGEQVGSSGDG